MIISDGKQKLSEAFESFIKFKAFNTMSISDIAWFRLVFSTILSRSHRRQERAGDQTNLQKSVTYNKSGNQSGSSISTVLSNLI